MGKQKNKRPGCQVFVPDPEDRRFDIECGVPYVGEVTVQLPARKGMASVKVCDKHKRIINSQAARLRTEAKVSR